MSTSSFSTTPVSPILPLHNESSKSRTNYQGAPTQSLSQNKLTERSALAAALAYLDSPDEALDREEHLAAWARRSRAHDDIGASSSEPSDQLERLIAKADAFDESALTTLVSKFPGLEDSPNPLAQLTAYGADPGLAALVMAGLLGSTEERWRRLREKLIQDNNLKKTLARYLKESGGEIAISLFSFLEFNDVQQLDTMRKLYGYTADSCRTLGELFNHFINLDDRDKKLRALLRALAFELSQMSVGSKEYVRLVTVMRDLSQLLSFLSLEAICAETAVKLNGLINSPRSIEAKQILKELIFIVEQAWVDAEWLEGRIAMLIGTGEIAIKLQSTSVLREVWKNLPMTLFDDEEKHKNVFMAFDTLIHTLNPD